MKLPLLMMVLAAAACGGSEKTTTTTTTTTKSEPVMIEEESVAQTVAEETGPTPPADGPLPESQPVESPPTIPPPTLDKAAIRSVIRRNIPYIAKCYEEELLKQPGLQGTTTVSFMILPSGEVESAVGAGMDVTVDLCVANFIATLSFPQSTNGTQVNYPFKFAQAGGTTP